MKTYIILYSLPQFHTGNSRATLPRLPSLGFAFSLLHTPSISNLAAIVGKAASFFFSLVVLMTPLLRHPLKILFTIMPFLLYLCRLCWLLPPQLLCINKMINHFSILREKGNCSNLFLLWFLNPCNSSVH